MPDAIQFNSFGLQNANIITQYVRVSPPQLNISERGFPRADGEYAEYAFNQRTIITISGVVTAATQALMEAQMDLLKQALATRGGQFVYTFAGAYRYYDACYALDIEKLFDKRDHFHTTWCPFDIQLVCTAPYGRPASRDVNGTLHFTANGGFNITNAGTAPTAPIITLTLTNASGDITNIVITNTTTGEVLTIPYANGLGTGIVITINGETKSISFPGQSLDYVGVIPSLQAGVNAFTIAVTSGHEYDVQVNEQHYQKFY